MKIAVRMSAFHGRHEREYPTIARAFREARTDCRDCTCGGSAVVVSGTEVELQTLGAWETKYGEWVLRAPEGDCTVEVEDEEDAPQGGFSGDGPPHESDSERSARRIAEWDARA